MFDRKLVQLNEFVAALFDCVGVEVFVRVAVCEQIGCGLVG